MNKPFALVLAASALFAPGAGAQDSLPEAATGQPSDAATAEPLPRVPTSPPPALLFPALLGETDYRVYPSEAEGYTGFAVDRLRLGLIFAPAPWLRAVGNIEFAGEYPVILDAFARLRAADWLEFTVGYSKPPLFASFIYEPVHLLPFPEPAAVVTSFRVDRDVGVDAHFSPRELPIEGWLRVGNGTRSPLGNDNALPAGYASLDFVWGRAWVGAAPEDRTFGLRLGGGVMVENARDRNGIIGETPLGFIYFRPIVVSGLRTIQEGHLVGYAGPLRLTVEGALASESRSRDDDGNPRTPRVPMPTMHSSGLTMELAWVIHGLPREVGRGPRGTPSYDGAWTGGAVEIAARYDAMWLGRGADDVRAGGSHGGAMALKWWPVDFMAATLFGYATSYDVPPIEAPEEFWSWGLVSRLGFFWGAPSEPQQRN